MGLVSFVKSLLWDVANNLGYPAGVPIEVPRTSQPRHSGRVDIIHWVVTVSRYHTYAILATGSQWVKSPPSKWLRTCRPTTSTDSILRAELVWYRWCARLFWSCQSSLWQFVFLSRCQRDDCAMIVASNCYGLVLAAVLFRWAAGLFRLWTLYQTSCTIGSVTVNFSWYWKSYKHATSGRASCDAVINALYGHVCISVGTSLFACKILDQRGAVSCCEDLFCHTLKTIFWCWKWKFHIRIVWDIEILAPVSKNLLNLDLTYMPPSFLICVYILSRT